MKIILPLFVLITFISCRDKKEKFNYETSIASTVYKAQSEYFDKTIFNYARISDLGNYYWNENQLLEEQTDSFKAEIKNGHSIPQDEQDSFFNHFEKTFANHGLINFDKFKQLKESSIKTISDIDILEVYIKNNFVAVLLNNKLLPYDSWGIMVSGKNEINNGETLNLNVATYAFRSYHQNEWYLVNKVLNDNDTLKRENIIDTLYPQENGMVNFETKNYKKGKNTLIFLSRLSHPPKDRMISQEISFYVK